LYREILQKLVENGIIGLEESPDVILRTGFINIVENWLQKYFKQYNRKGGKPSARIHKDNLEQFHERWSNIRSDDVCFACLRQIPQYNLPCGHCICRTCVVNFGEQTADDPWEFRIHQCFLCMRAMNLLMKIDPPTAGVGVLCLDGGGVRGIVPLTLMRRIQDQIGLPISLQRFFKAAFGVSSGQYILSDRGMIC
jgi:hypothetical protein